MPATSIKCEMKIVIENKMSTIKTILVTGGAGFIGSHFAVLLLEAGYQVVVVDDLSNSMCGSLKRVCDITSRPLVFYKCDIRDLEALRNVFRQHTIDCVVHFAGSKSVGKSMSQPLQFYSNNATGAIRLLEAMKEAKVNKLVFSSSSTVYGKAIHFPTKECDSTGSVQSVYGRTKFFVEEILKDVSKGDKENNWQIICLRYFNPIGCHHSGKLGEHGTKQATNLLPFISQVAAGSKEKLHIYGNDYDTKDGTGTRDYVHVMDLSRGHLDAIEHLFDGTKKQPPYQCFNLGSSRPITVLELVQAFEKASGKTVPYDFVARRPGDVDTTWCDPTLAYRTLGWRAEKTIEQMCEDVWRWQCMNPRGYSDDEPFPSETLDSNNGEIQVEDHH